MNAKKYTLDELTEAVNKELEKEDLITTDSRQSTTLSARRIRDFATKGLISKPIKEGRNAYYTDVHLNELINLKQLQSKGLNEKTLQSFKSEYSTLSTSEVSESGNEDQSLDDLISSIKSSTNINEEPKATDSLRGISGSTNLNSLDTLNKKKLDLDNSNPKDLLRTLSSYCGKYDEISEESSMLNKIEPEIIPEKWEEYKLSDEVILKIREGSTLNNLEEIQEQLNKISKQLKK